jgi:WD40 repeat protein
LLLDTPAGSFLADLASGTAAALLDGGGSERSALLASGSIATAERGTDEIVIIHDGRAERHRIGLDAGQTVLDVDASPDGSVIGVTSGAGTSMIDRQDSLSLLDATTLERIATIGTGVALAPWEWLITDTAFAVARDGELRMWTLDGAGIDVTSPVDSGVDAVVPLGRDLLTVHRDGTLVRWAADGGSAQVVREGDDVVAVTASPDQSSFTVVDRYGVITVHDAESGATTQTERRFATGALTAVDVGPGGSIGVASTTGEIVLFADDLTHERTIAVSDQPSALEAISISPVDGSVATGVAERVGPTAFDDTVVAVGRDGTPSFRTGGEREDVAGCAFFFGRVRHSPDGRILAVASHDFSVIVLDAVSGAELTRLEGDTTVLDIAFSPSGERLLATYDDGLVRTWDVDDFDVRSEFRGVQGGYFAVGFADDHHIAAADITGKGTVMRVDDGHVVTTLSGAATRTTTMAVSADGALIALPSGVGGVSGHSEPVTGLAFIDEASMLVTVSVDGTVRTWTVDSAA